MSDSVKQKKTIHCPLFYRGFSFHMQDISRSRYGSYRALGPGSTLADTSAVLWARVNGSGRTVGDEDFDTVDFSNVEEIQCDSYPADPGADE
jgi:hypothetical protein